MDTTDPPVCPIIDFTFVFPQNKKKFCFMEIFIYIIALY